MINASVWGATTQKPLALRCGQGGGLARRFCALAGFGGNILKIHAAGKTQKVRIRLARAAIIGCVGLKRTGRKFKLRQWPCGF